MSFRTLPVPTIAPVMVWVVETGIAEGGREEERDRAAGLGAEARRPAASLVIRMPIVRTMRHPPESVPRPIAAWQASTTQNGTRRLGSRAARC